MKNNIKKLAALSLLSILGLTACNSTTTSDIYAKPTGYSDSVVSIDGVAGYNNMEKIYDAWHEGNISTSVLNQLLYQYSISTFGRYNTYIKGPITTYSLKEAAEDIEGHINNINSISQATKDFITNHRAYHVLKGDGSHDLDKECGIVLGKYNAVEKRIAERMYNSISSGSYTTEFEFSEKKFLRALRSDYKDVADPEDLSTPLYKGMILPSVEPEQVFDAGILHRENYQSEKIHYIEENIIPEIYAELLNEQYLFDEASRTVGRSHARKINVFSITARSGLKDAKSAEYLINYLFEMLTEKPSGDTWDNTDKLNLFKEFSNAWVGTVTLNQTSGNYENAILEHIINQQGLSDKIVFERQGDPSTSDVYYNSTDRGVWMEQYSKIDDDLAKTDTAAESDFTGGGSYTKVHGKELKERETELKDYTSTGWYISSNGVDTLPESISSRLFEISVADAKKESLNTEDGVEYAGQYDRWQKKEGEWSYSKDNDYNAYLARINGSYFLKSTSTIVGAEDQDIVFKDGDNYYIVQVLEAVNSTKMGSTSLNYTNLGRLESDVQDMTNEIAHIIAKGSSYQELAKDHWMKQMSISYHDTVVYNYFKDNYPDLFE